MDRRTALFLSPKKLLAPSLVISKAGTLTWCGQLSALLASLEALDRFLGHPLHVQCPGVPTVLRNTLQRWQGPAGSHPRKRPARVYLKPATVRGQRLDQLRLCLRVT